MTKTLGNFKLAVEAGSFTDSEIIVMLGENGTGKTTFVHLLAGDTPDEETDKQSFAVSLKPQTISPKFPGTVQMLLLKQIRQVFMHPQFQMDVLKLMCVEAIMDRSGCEDSIWKRVAESSYRACAWYSFFSSNFFSNCGLQVFFSRQTQRFSLPSGWT